MDNNEAVVRDYLAIVPMGVGSSWGRGKDKETAIDNCIRALRDWEVYYKVSDVDITVNVIDVTGYSTCRWGSYGEWYVHGTNEATGEDEPIKRKFEKVTRHTPKWKKRARR